MQNQERFTLSSSPSKLWDNIAIDDSTNVGIPGPIPMQSSNSASYNNNNMTVENPMVPISWTPYVDKVMRDLETNNGSRISPFQSRQHSIQFQLQQAQPLIPPSSATQNQNQYNHQQQQQLLQQHYQHNLQYQQGQFNINSSPQKFDAYQPHQHQQQHQQQHSHQQQHLQILQYAQYGQYQQQQPQTQIQLQLQQQQQQQQFSQDLFLANLQTPGSAEKSFKISDYFDSPQFKDLKDLKEFDLSGFLASAENDNKENDPTPFNFGTPLNQKSKSFKTPLRELCNTPRLLGSASVRKLSLSAVSASKHLSFQHHQQQYQQYHQDHQQSQNHMINLPSTTPSKSNYKTPLKSEHPQSSPSTIIMSSTKKSIAIKGNSQEQQLPQVQQQPLEMSPTPTAKSSLKTAPCQLVKSASNLEPVIGIFQDKKLPPKMSTFSSNGQSLKGRKKPDSSNGSGKFQIIFTDMNTLKGSYGGSKGKKQRKLERSKTTNSITSTLNQNQKSISSAKRLQQQLQQQQNNDRDKENQFPHKTKKQKKSNSLVKVNSVPVIMPSSSSSVSNQQSSGEQSWLSNNSKVDDNGTTTAEVFNEIEQFLGLNEVSEK